MKQEINRSTSGCFVRVLGRPPQGPGMEDMQTQRVRDDRIDAIKYWLIVLVIAGHVFRRPEFVDSVACNVLKQWIYVFHMPLFIFFSGYFSRKKDYKDFWPSIWKLLEPLLFFQMLMLLPRILHSGTDNLLVTILTPWYVLWYLLSLIYWRIMLQIIPDKILKYRKLLLISTFVISILAGFLPVGKCLAIQKTLAFMPFFFFGYYMRDKNLYLLDKYKPLSIVFLIAMFLVSYFYLQYLDELSHAVPYHSIYGATQRMFVFALAIPMSMAFMNVCHKTPWIALQGRMSMQYFIYHALLITPVFMIAGKLGVPMSFLTATIVSIGITFVIYILLKLPYIKEFTNPSVIFKRKRIANNK